MSKQNHLIDFRWMSDITLEELGNSVDHGIKWRADCERRGHQWFGRLFSWGVIENSIRTRVDYIVSVLPQVMKASALGVSFSDVHSIFDLDGAVSTEIDKLRSRADELETLLMEIRNG